MKNSEAKKEVVLTFENKEHLLCQVISLISVCETALHFHEDNRLPQYNDFQHEQITGSSFYNLTDVLKMSKDMLRECI
ncbi:hypothetical protein [Flavobacterium oreochromis]|uniref:Uncharacterized protein n=1 Tax=Flavobacterium columnare TaxID=996 RepID=A0A246GEC8_9FLAO|nr:hypothetical protein [Flavobacterium oreochromis]OWP79730.1 hypothetical protein BWK62_00385 [Flavobacterium oreochromis]